MKEFEKCASEPLLTLNPDLDKLDLGSFRSEKLERSIRNSKVYGLPPLNSSQDSQ